MCYQVVPGPLALCLAVTRAAARESLQDPLFDQPEGGSHWSETATSGSGGESFHKYGTDDPAVVDRVTLSACSGLGKFGPWPNISRRPLVTFVPYPEGGGRSWRRRWYLKLVPGSPSVLITVFTFIK